MSNDEAGHHAFFDHRVVGDVELSYFRTDLDPDAFMREATPIARCYQHVYGTDGAWNEGKVCRACTEQAPLSPKKWNYRAAPDRCDACDGSLDDFWPVQNVLSDMRIELALPDAVCVVARINAEVVGACWGFSATAEEMEEHLNHGLAPDARVLNVARTLRDLFPGEARVAYQDEIFVDPNRQGHGLGRHLFRMRHEAFVKRGLVGYVLRTKQNPPARSYLWYKCRWGYETIGQYPDADQRVVLASDFHNIRGRLGLPTRS